MSTSDITPEEKELGFFLIHVSQGYGSILGGEETEPVAVLPLGESDYLFKTEWPNAGFGYMHKRRGYGKVSPEIFASLARN